MGCRCRSWCRACHLVRRGGRQSTKSRVPPGWLGRETFFFEQGDEKNKNAASQKATKPSPLATYSGFLGVQNGEVYMCGEASVGGEDMPRAARALAATFAAKVLRRQIKRSLTDIKAVADETSNASKHPHK